MSDVFTKVPPGVDVYPNGDPILVLRPMNPRVTLALAQVALQHDSEEALKKALTNGPCKFLGFLMSREDGVFAVDENGENPIRVESGDIFSGPENIRKPD